MVGEEIISSMIVWRKAILWVILSVFILVFPLPASAQDDCLECHGDEDLTGVNKAGVEYSLFIDGTKYESSVHGEDQCISCHSGIEEIPHAEQLPEVNCGDCHAEEAKIFQWHGYLKVGESPDMPGCADCHGKHDIVVSTERRSRVNPLNLPQTCGRCHEDLDLVKKYEILMQHPVEIFESSIHGRASLGGIYLAATCNDCHSTDGTAHKILAPGLSESAVNHFNIPRTCGKCHRSIENDYEEGIHGKLTLRGVTDSPICTDCHGEHGILSPDDPRSPVSPTRVAEMTCSPCHESAKLNEKYGVSAGRLKTWVDSFHGLKSKTGDITVANCASCHGAHRILPSSDSTSSINPANLQTTCGHCHPGISLAVASIPIHGTPGVTHTPLAALIQKIYIGLIIVIIGGMVLHWLIDLRKQIKLVNQKKQIRRMTYNEVWQHTFLTITFTTLVITGFSLRFSEAWWVKFLFGWEGGFPLRGIIHRVAAALLLLTAIWHLIYLSTKRGRRFFSDMIATLLDLKQLWQMLSYNLGFSKTKPRFGRFSYVEKTEYWAVVWGTIIMVFTGFFLWFENLAIRWFPKGFLDVMLVIHYYEAWLATLAIFIWHMYSTVFSPGVYPMNPAWYTGKMPLEQYKHEHPEDPDLKNLIEELKSVEKDSHSSTAPQ
jgi:cytochrome b subunit of formate dehydrogenase